VTAPAANSSASTREVLPTPPWPTTPTLRSFAVSIIHGPPADDVKWRSCYHRYGRGLRRCRTARAPREEGGWGEAGRGPQIGVARRAHEGGWEGRGGPRGRRGAARERGGVGEAGRAPPGGAGGHGSEGVWGRRTGPPNRSRAPRERGGLGEAGRVPQIGVARHANEGVWGKRDGSPKSESRATRTRGFGGSGTGPPSK